MSSCVCESIFCAPFVVPPSLLLGTAASSSVYKKFFPPPKQSTQSVTASTFQDCATRSGRVLTSAQYMEQMREKEALKLQKQKAAEERQQLRLQKRLEKEQLQKEKRTKKQSTYSHHVIDM